MLRLQILVMFAAGILATGCSRTTPAAGGTEGALPASSSALADAALPDVQEDSSEDLADIQTDGSKAEYPNVNDNPVAAPLPPLSSHVPAGPGPKPFSADFRRNTIIEAVKKQAEVCHRSVGANQAGRLRMIVGVGAKGEILQVTATASGTLSRALALCVEGRAKKLKFEPSDHGAVTETFPLILRP